MRSCAEIRRGKSSGRNKSSFSNQFNIKEVFKLTKTDIFSGFLGAGKTTLIKKLIAEAYKGEKLVIIENEFGDIGKPPAPNR